MTGFIQAVTTTETEDQARQIARAVVEQRLAACAQIIGPICSTYWWKGKIETAGEWMCVMKSRSDLFAELEKAIRAVHPYDVPEIVATPIVAGSDAYLNWLSEELRPPS